MSFIEIYDDTATPFEWRKSKVFPVGLKTHPWTAAILWAYKSVAVTVTCPQ